MNISRYLRIYWQFIKINFNLLLVYRANLVNHVINSVAWTFFLFMSVFLLTSQVPSIAGWDRSSLLILASMYNLVIGVFYVICTTGFRDMASVIFLGKLDMYLLKPIDSQFHVSLHAVNLPGLVRPLIGAVCIAILLAQNNLHPSAFSLFLFVASLIVTLVFLYSVWFLIMTLLIWFPRLENLVELIFGISGQGKNPREVLKPFGSSPLIFLILPFFLTVSVPAKQLLGKGNLIEIIIFGAVAIVLFILSQLFWKYALRSYVGGSV